MKTSAILVVFLLSAVVCNSVSAQGSTGNGNDNNNNNNNNNGQGARKKPTPEQIILDVFVGMTYDFTLLGNRFLDILKQMGENCGCTNLVQNQSLPRFVPFHFGLPPPPPPGPGQGQGQGPAGQAGGQQGPVSGATGSASEGFQPPRGQPGPV